MPHPQAATAGNNVSPSDCRHGRQESFANAGLIVTVLKYEATIALLEDCDVGNRADSQRSNLVVSI
jgi:hypothetical protein